MAIATINPATGKRLREFDELTSAEIERRVRRAHDVFATWSHTPLDDRIKVVARAAELLDQRKEEYGRLMTLEMGKLYAAAREEAAKCATGCRYYAEHAKEMLADEFIATGDEYGYVAFHPLGVVLAIMPWNFPFWQVIRFAAPALVAGNVGLLKHASSVPQCALALEQLFRDAGAPEGVFQTLLIGSETVAGIISDRRIAARSPTGCPRAPHHLATHAGSGPHNTMIPACGDRP